MARPRPRSHQLGARAIRPGTVGASPLSPWLRAAGNPARRARRVRALGAGTRPATAPPPGTPPPPARSGGAAGASVVIWPGGGYPAQARGRAGRCGRAGWGSLVAPGEIGGPDAREPRGAGVLSWPLPRRSGARSAGAGPARARGGRSSRGDRAFSSHSAHSSLSSSCNFSSALRFNLSKPEPEGADAGGGPGSSSGALCGSPAHPAGGGAPDPRGSLGPRRCLPKGAHCLLAADLCRLPRGLALTCGGRMRAGSTCTGAGGGSRHSRSPGPPPAPTLGQHFPLAGPGLCRRFLCSGFLSLNTKVETTFQWMACFLSQFGLKNCVFPLSPRELFWTQVFHFGDRFKTLIRLTLFQKLRRLICQTVHKLIK